LQCRNLSADIFDLRRRVLHVQAGTYSLVGTLSRACEDILGDFQIFDSDTDLHLDAAQLNVVAGHFRETRDEGVAALFRGLIDLRIGRFDLAAYAAPQVELPGGVEADVIFIERCWNQRNRPRRAGQELVNEAEGTVYAEEFALVFRVAVHGGKCRGGSDAPLKSAFCQPNCRCLHIQIFGSDAAQEVGEDRVAKHRPPVRVGRLLQKRIGGLPGVGAGG